jgi:serine/threonine protein kinase
MNEEESIFGTEPERLMRLMKSGLRADESEVENEAGQTVPAGNLPEQPGARIGRYKLLRILGEGGMGIVYLAEQQGSIRRRVALKVIKPGMDSKRVLARFEVERQALALLDHLNVANVYDAGTTESGRPYFVMEYVKGLPITDYCDHHKLTIEQRLKLFQQVCHAVQHAHQKGIIHRDIKPSNILVSTQDDKAVPNIIDFGVAKAINQPLTERTLLTEDSQLLGTPEYMSPEQADMAGENIDTRSDIYSLGVLLYVLLTGVLPFDSDTLREGGLDHVRKVIRETDPKTPSTRLSKLGEEAKKVAKSRRIEVGALAKCLHRELEWIPIKAMRKERSERYRSASELADDIDNYLNGAPLIAGPPGTIYRLKKFVRRHKALVTGIVAVLVVLFGGIVVSTLFALGQARARAEAQAIADFLTDDLISSVDPTIAKNREITIQSFLDSVSENLNGKFEDKPLVEAKIRQTLGWTYRGLNLYKMAELHLERALQIYKEELSEEHPETLQCMSYLGWVYHDQGLLENVERITTKTLELKRRVYGEKHPATLGSMNHLALLYENQGRYEEAEQLLLKVIEFRRQTLSEQNDDVVMPIGNLAGLYINQGRYDEAEQLLVQMLESAVKVWGEDGAWTIFYTGYLARVYKAQGRYEEAERLYKKTLNGMVRVWGQKNQWVLSRINELAQLYIDQDRYNEADKLLSKALDAAKNELNNENMHRLSLLNSFAVLRTKQVRYDEAERLFNEALKGRQSRLGEDHPHTLETKNDLAMLYMDQARYDEAEPLLVEAVEGRIQKLGLQHPHTRESIDNLIELYEAWDKPEKAEHWRAKLASLDDGKSTTFFD